MRTEHAKINESWKLIREENHMWNLNHDVSHEHVNLTNNAKREWEM